jgi:hypothetical protein
MPKRASLPRLPRPTKTGLKQQAYDLLGIEEADIVMVPKIEPLLKKAGVLEKVWDYLETSGDDMARHLIAQKYKLKNVSQRKALPFEAFCFAAHLDTKKVLALIFVEVYSQNQQASELMAAGAQPEIVQATIDAAKFPGGTNERRMLLSRNNFIPVPKTSITHVHGAGKVVAGDDNSNNVAVLPPIETTVRQLSDRFNQLPAPSAVDEMLDVEFSEDDDEDEDLLT